MITWAAIRPRLRALLQARTVRRELDEELRFHLEMEAMHRQHAGANAVDAKYAARRRLGNPTLIAEEVYRMSWRHSLEELAQDPRLSRGAEQSGRTRGGHYE